MRSEMSDGHTNAMAVQPAAAGTQAGRALLGGVRMLDMATVLAAPFAATLCADLGAEVVKLELPEGGDALRGLAPVEGDHALFWKVTNRDKRGITLDVRKPEGRELLLAMLPRFDVLVENFRAGTLERWGLGMATLLAANPRLIVLRLTGFGQDGPSAGRPGFARIFEAMSGLTNLIGTEQSGPQHPNFPIGDTIAGVFGAFSIAAAVAHLRADANAPGMELDLAATEAVFRMLDPLAVEHERLGFARGRAGNRATYTAPSNMYRTGDGRHVTLVASSDPIFARLCEAMSRPELACDPRFSSNPQRCCHLDALDEQIAGWFVRRSYDQVRAALDAADVPYTLVYGIVDILADEHMQARGMVTRIADPELGSLPAPCTVPRVDRVARRPTRSGPATGEHNDAFYAQLGLTAERIGQLQASKVI